MDEDGVVVCQSLYQSIGEEEWIDMHEPLKEVCKDTGVKNAGQKVAGVGKVAWRNMHKEVFLSAKDEQVVFGRRSALRQSLLSPWQVDINQAFRVCEDRQTQIDASETSYVCFD